METLKKACRSLNLDIITSANNNLVIIKKYNKEFMFCRSSMSINNSVSCDIVNNKELSYIFFKQKNIPFMPYFSINNPKYIEKDTSSLIIAFNYLSEFTNGIVMKGYKNMYYVQDINAIENAWLNLFKTNADKILVSPFFQVLNEWRIVTYNEKIYSCVKKTKKKNGWQFNCENLVNEGDLMLVANHLKHFVNKATQALNIKCCTIDIIQVNKDIMNEKQLKMCDDFGFIIMDITPFPKSIIEDKNSLDLWLDILNDYFKNTQQLDYNSCVTRLIRKQLLN